MKIFLSDLWHDLREKRLWPVAVLLVAGLAAVPLVLAKPATEPPPATAPPPEASQDSDLKGLAKVVLAEDKASNGSKLNLFDSSDPFRPPKSVLEQGDEPSPSTGVSEGGATPLPGGGSGPEGPTSFGPTEPGGGTTPSQPEPKPKTTSFTYVIDATFVNGNRTRKIKGMQRLDMLPNQDNPLLLFLGVDAKADNAVFLIDSRLQTSGEGVCKPSAEDCSFLYLGAGSQALFTEDTGESYGLRIDQIRKVKVGAKKSSNARTGKQKGKSGRSKARVSSRQPFVPRLLTDLVTVTSDEYEASRPSRDRR